jgi:hypothetical protein
LGHWSQGEHRRQKENSRALNANGRFMETFSRFIFPPLCDHESPDAPSSFAAPAVSVSTWRAQESAPPSFSISASFSAICRPSSAAFNCIFVFWRHEEISHQVNGSLGGRTERCSLIAAIFSWPFSCLSRLSTFPPEGNPLFMPAKNIRKLTAPMSRGNDRAIFPNDYFSLIVLSSIAIETVMKSLLRYQDQTAHHCKLVITVNY